MNKHSFIKGSKYQFCLNFRLKLRSTRKKTGKSAKFEENSFDIEFFSSIIHT